MLKTQIKLSLIFFGCVISFGVVKEVSSQTNQINLISLDKSIVAEANYDCFEPQTTSQMNYCSGLEMKEADEQLNLIYQQLTGKLSDLQKQRLTKAQLAWIDFRDKTCEYEKGQFEGGSIALSTYNYCLTRITKQRITDLENYLQQTNL